MPAWRTRGWRPAVSPCASRTSTGTPVRPAWSSIERKSAEGQPPLLLKGRSRQENEVSLATLVPAPHLSSAVKSQAQPDLGRGRLATLLQGREIMSSSPLAGANVAILGATGAVGQELITVLRRRAPDLGSLTCYASARGGKRRLQVEGEEVTVLPYSREAIAADTLVFMAVSGDFSRTEAPALVERGALVIDNSSAFRYDPEVPLVVPEVNGDAVAGARLISNPICTTSILVPALAALHKGFGLKRVIVSTYQAASGAGAAGMEELQQGVARQLAGEPVPAEAFVHPLAFNVIPHIDSFQENGYTREEMKVVLEGRKILGLPELPMSCTAVRVPTLRAHGEARSEEHTSELQSRGHIV